MIEAKNTTCNSATTIQTINRNKILLTPFDAEDKKINQNITFVEINFTPIMKKHLLLSVLILLHFSIAFAQKKAETVTVNVNGKSIVIRKGSIFSLGLGSNTNGDFVYIYEERILQGGGRTTINLDKKYSYTQFYVQSIYYYKSTNKYVIYIRNKLTAFNQVLITQAVEKGELLAIDGIELGSAKISNTPSTSISTTTHILYLKNGSEIKCNIVELTPNETVKVMTTDKSIFVFNFSEIKELKKDETSVTQAPVNIAFQPISDPTFEVKKVDSAKLRKQGFIDYFFLQMYFPNKSITRQSNVTSNAIGFGVNNTFAYKFNPYFSLGAGIGYNMFTGSNATNYSFGTVYGLQHVSILGDKIVSPEVILSEGFGILLNEGKRYDQNANQIHIGKNIGAFEALLGINVRLTKQIKLHLDGGYSYQIFDTQNQTAQYFMFKLGISYFKPRLQ